MSLVQAGCDPVLFCSLPYGFTYVDPQSQSIQCPKESVWHIPKILRKHYKIMDLSNKSVPCKQIVFCYLHTNKGTAVGISICSELDEFNKSIGERISFGRAQKALKNRHSSDLIRKPEYICLRDYGIFSLSLWVGDDK